jgi:iron complex outermembrane recepter protein
VVSVGWGNLEQMAQLRYGAAMGEGGAFRVYAKAFERDAQELGDGSSAHDDWRKVQAGFRADFTEGQRVLTAQGDLYGGEQRQVVAGEQGGTRRDDQDVKGGNLLTRWQQGPADQRWQVQAYYDFTERAAPADGVAFWLRTYDLELQHSRTLGRHRLIGGAGVRLHDYDIRSSPTLQFDPEHRDLTLANLFFQDTMALTSTVNLTVGLKFERDGFGKWSPLPDLRVGWRISPTSLLWAAAARAIRSPTPFDRDVVEILGDTVFLVGNGSFDPERVDTLELGFRAQPWPNLSGSTSVFYNRYEDLRSIELDPASGFLPLRWGNGMHGRTYGLEAWGHWQVRRWWRVSPGIRILRKDLAFDESSSGLVGYRQSGNDPKTHALLTSAMDLGAHVRFNATFRYVGTLPSPRLDDHTELSAALQWQVRPSIELSVTGLNLMSDRHLEYPAPSGAYIQRAVFFQVEWRP